MVGRRGVLAASILLALILAASVYLFRADSYRNPALGTITTHYVWGKPRIVKVDSNADGRADFRAIVDAPFGAFRTHMFRVREIYEDRDFDGIFELHVQYGAGGQATARIDQDGDGTPEQMLEDFDFEEYIRQKEDFFKSRGGSG
jgi:hypothetical protein